MTEKTDKPAADAAPWPPESRIISLKRLAKEHNRPLQTLIALHQTNDPFAIFESAYRRRDAEWFAALWRDLELPWAFTVGAFTTSSCLRLRRLCGPMGAPTRTRQIALRSWTKLRATPYFLNWFLVPRSSTTKTPSQRSTSLNQRQQCWKSMVTISPPISLTIRRGRSQAWTSRASRAYRAYRACRAHRQRVSPPCQGSRSAITWKSGPRNPR